MTYPCPYCPTVASRANNLRTHLMGRRFRGGHELSHEDATRVIDIIESKSPARAPTLGSASADKRTRQPVVTSTSPLLNRGHWQSLELLERPELVRATLALYEQAIGHPVYLRPTALGLTVISLDPSTPAMVGVGGSGDCCIDTVPPTPAFIEAAVSAYRAKVAAMTRDSAEERHVIARIRAALASHLALGDGLLFLHQEWRFSTSEKLDVLALDARTSQLVVIEAKSTKNAAMHERDARGRTASEQAASYAAQLLARSSECTPFFQRLALALGRIYCPERPMGRVDGSALPRCELWWPGGSALVSPNPSPQVPPAAEAIEDTLPLQTSQAGPVDAVIDVTSVASDTAWQRELRRRQSRWREGCGYPMGSHDGRPLGSRLAMPEAEEKLWNFITPAIGDLVRREYIANGTASREHQKVYGYPRLFADLLSSQPLAFNLFGECALDPAIATKAARRLWPSRVERVTRIEFEWSPGRWNPSYLGNDTAGDVVLFHTTPNGGSGVVFIETKYHEDLRDKDYPLKPRYHEVALYSGAFLKTAPLQSDWLQQLWLDHLLVLATQMADGLDSALFVLAYPEINERCHEAGLAYRAALDTRKAATFEAKTLEEIVSVFEEDSRGDWTRRFRERYLVPTT